MTIPTYRDSRRPLRLATGCLLAFALLQPARFAAAQPAPANTPPLGEVEVEASGEAAYAEAMRTVLVRVTGRRSAAEDPLFLPLLQEARRYVQIYRPPAGGAAARITLDAAAIERALVQLGQPVWSRERPLVLGVITAAPTGADPVAVRAELERAAGERGLPLRLVAAAAAGLAAGTAVTTESALLAARRAGAGALLLGEADGDAWQWTLFDGAAASVFHGETTAGVEGAADTLALGSQAVAAQPVGSAEFRVRGVRSLKDYADLQRILDSQPAIRSAELVASGAEGAWFRVEVAGGTAGLAEALAAQPRLRREGGGREGGGNEPLRYVFAGGT